MEIDKIHHFPGHMKKAFDTLSRLLSLVDLVIEIVWFSPRPIWPIRSGRSGGLPITGEKAMIL